MAPTFAELEGGLVKLLQTAEWDDSEVALLYSMPSIQISWMMDSERDGRSWNQRSNSYEPDHISHAYDHVGWNKLLEDNGVKGRWMSCLELTNGTLDSRGVKVLILPRALALSQEERDAIEAWVAAGGTLVADSLTGIYDERLHRRSIQAGGGLWDSFLGVKRVDFSFREMNGVAGSAFNESARPATGAPPARFKRLLDGVGAAGLRAVEPGLRTADATPLLHFGGREDRPALLVKEHGSGAVVYLGIGVTKYGFASPAEDDELKVRSRKRARNSAEQPPDARLASARRLADPTGADERQTPASESATNLRRLILNLLELGGVRPRMRVTQGQGETDVYNYEKAAHRLPGGGLVFGCVVNSFQDNAADDWGARNDTAAVCFGQPGADRASATLHLAAKAHLYDSRAGRYLGEGTDFAVALPVYEGAVFTALQYHVTGLRVQVQDIDSLHKVTVSVEVLCQSGTASDTHVLVLSAAAADGTAIPLLTRKVVAAEGRWQGVVPFGANQALAGCTISARDVATGSNSTVRVVR